SVHATGGNAERNSTACAPCHTSQGFLEVNAEGGFTADAPGNSFASASISNPMQPNCYTCHDIHNSYTTDDWNLTKSDATVAWHAVDGSTAVSADLGAGNMCTGCHQGRAMSQQLTNWNDGGTATLTPGSYRWGLHHGPQYNVLIGEGMFEFEGTSEYPGQNHVKDAAADACVTCHMGEAYGDAAGGHTWNMTYMSYGTPAYIDAPETCTECHVDGGIADELGTVYTSVKDEIEILLTTLGTALENEGVIQPGTVYLTVDAGGDPIDQTEEMLAAAVNYQIIKEDRSMGIHNYDYTKAVLENTLEVVFGI
ncbi:MAG: hypothetical protein ACQEQW_06060, partial [Bacteroidota bacterium]